ncbi:MAG TPA: hypothetical protein VFA54_12870 [Bryobacterales bacterium]|nr:hypothetical protein [Bryobacterales bacterium]
MTGAALAACLATLAAAIPGAAQTPSAPRRVSAPISFYDDADPTDPGVLSASASFSYTRVDAGHDLDGPSAYLSLGLHKRIEVSADLGRAESLFEETRISGIADSYLAAKFLVFPEGRRRPALALKPMLEILGPASIHQDVLAPGRVNFVPSFILQKSFDDFRVYYMGGYVTRGILFHSLAGELNLWSRVTPTVILSAARVTREAALISDLGLNRSRADATVSLTIMLTPRWSVFAGGGRSFGRSDLNSSCYAFSGGAAFHFRLWGEK